MAQPISSPNDTTSTQLDGRLAPEARYIIEQGYYQPINDNGRFDYLHEQLGQLTMNSDIVGLFPDHGVIHMRDVAVRVPALLEKIHETLIPARSPERLEWMKSIGILLACLHDIGMVDGTVFGRKMHPEFAVHALFSTSLATFVETIYHDDRGCVRPQLQLLQDDGLVATPIPLLLREILSLCVGHSKSKVPVEMLNDPTRLRQRLINILAHDLATLNRAASSPAPSPDGQTTDLPKLDRLFINKYDADLTTDGFLWLTDAHPRLVALREDVIDTVRVLRAADALRQRGSVLKSSGGYEIIVDQQSGQAVYAIRDGSERLFLLKLPILFSAGEANIASSEVDRSGDLRISFAQGRFYTPEAFEFAQSAAVKILLDIINDVVLAFQRSPDAVDRALKKSSEILILLEEPRRNPHFAHEVAQQITALRPDLEGRIEVVPSLGDATPLEIALYDGAALLTPDPDSRTTLLANMRAAGHNVAAINLEEGLRHARLVSLNADQILIEAGAPPNFVYIPLGPGLEVLPLGGYESFAVQPWMPLGITGVIRGAARNAAVRCWQPLSVIMIPRTVYLRHWHATLTPQELGDYLRPEA